MGLARVAGSNPMDVEVTHFVDASEPDANGQRDYYYEGDTYAFVGEGERLVVRTYVEDPSTGSVVKTHRQLDTSRLAPEVVGYLRSRGDRTLLCLGPSGTYEVWTQGD